MDSGEPGTSSPPQLKNAAREFAATELRVRPAIPPDHDYIATLLTELELDYPSRDLAKFFVGEKTGQILAIAELKEFRSFWLLSCVGVKERCQGSGLGRALLTPLLKSLQKDVYLYTLAPGFFRKLGFVETTSPPADVPSRSIYGCISCDPRFCLCMVRKPNAPRIS
jgi:N-acetylglutamate synthase-like GNAT family acetyltransferase